MRISRISGYVSQLFMVCRMLMIYGLLKQTMIFIRIRLEKTSCKARLFLPIYLYLIMGQAIYLFTGEEQYLVHQEVLRRKQNFSEKFGPDAIFEYKGNRDPSDAVSSLQWWWLFSTKKLVIVRWVPQDTIASNKVKIQQCHWVFSAIESLASSEAWSDDVLMVCVSYKPDKRKKEYKRFAKHAEIKEFKPLSGVWLRKRALGQLETYQFSEPFLDKEVLDHVLSLTGNDLRYVSHVLDMLCSWYQATWDHITKSFVDKAVYPRTQQNNFAFLDAFFVDEAKALRRLDEAKKSWVHWSMFLGAVYWGMKIIIQMTLLYDRWKTTSSILAKEVWWPPFTISRYLKFIPQLTPQKKNVLAAREQVVQLDYGIKTGKVVDTSFWVEMKRIVTDYHQ